MHSLSLTRVLPFVTLLAVAAAAACSDASDTCANQQTEGCNDVTVPPGCELGSKTCENGLVICPIAVCPALDGGASLACGNAFCNPTTEYCSITEGGAVSPDGGFNMGATCEPLPANCVGQPLGDSATCICLQDFAARPGGTCMVSNGLTLTIKVP